MEERITIQLHIQHAGENYRLQTYKHEYRSLMVLLYDKLCLPDFGECKGIGRCGTCAVRISGIPVAANELQRNEKRTLGKMNMDLTGVRLACQLAADEHLQEVSIEIIGADSVE